MAANPIEKNSVKNFARALDEAACLMKKIGIQNFATGFENQAKNVRNANSMREIRAVQKNIRETFVGTYETLNDILTVPRIGKLNEEDLDLSDKYFSILKKFSRKIFWS